MGGSLALALAGEAVVAMVDGTSGGMEPPSESVATINATKVRVLTKHEVPLNFLFQRLH